MSLRARAEAPLCFDGQEEALSSAVVSIHDGLVAKRGFAPLAFERKARGNYKPRSVRGDRVGKVGVSEANRDGFEGKRPSP